MKQQTLLLTRQEIQKVFGMREAIPVIEKTFRSYARGKVQMPAKSYLYLPRFYGDFRSMPAYIEDQNAVGVKWVNVHTQNFRKHLPTVMAMIILADVRTGYPIAVMDGTYLTNLRTGATGAVAAKYLARKKSSIIALIGSGKQAHTQLEGLNEIFKIKRVNVWSNDSRHDELFVKELSFSPRLRPGLDSSRRGGRGSPSAADLSPLLRGRGRGEGVGCAKSAEECVLGSDIIVTTTPSRKPIVKLKWIKKGAHINAIGADAKGKEELEPAILKHSKLVIDDWEQASHSGEINVPISKGILQKKDIYAELSDIIVGKKKGRTNDSEITVFDSTGLSIQDIACAHRVYQLAIRERLGTFKAFF